MLTQLLPEGGTDVMSSRRTRRVARPTAGSHGEGVDNQEVFLVQSASEDREDKLLEVLWAIRRSEREALWQPSSRSRKHCHLLLGLLLVIYLVEPVLKMTHRQQVAPHGLCPTGSGTTLLSTN